LEDARPFFDGKPLHTGFKVNVSWKTSLFETQGHNSMDRDEKESSLAYELLGVTGHLIPMPYANVMCCYTFPFGKLQMSLCGYSSMTIIHMDQ
jgi:hypothetical protein